MHDRNATSSLAAVIVAAVVILAGVGAYLTYFNQSPVQTGSTRPQKTPLITFSADAYSLETQTLLDGFSATAGEPVAPTKSGGSFSVANQIAAGAPDDVFVSAALSATSSAYLKGSASNWAIGFASDQMVVAFANDTISGPAKQAIASALQAEGSNSTSDWNSFFKALTSGSVKVGISDPVADPAGLRGWLALQLAGYLYAGGNATAFTSGLLATHANMTAPHAAGLVAQLQSGQIQFLLIYKSAAISSGLGYLTLDRHVSLGDPSLAPFYSRFSYRDSAGVIAGSPVVLSITVPSTSSNQEKALSFVEYVITHADSLSRYGLQSLSPARLYNSTSLPSTVVGWIRSGLIVESGALG